MSNRAFKKTVLILLILIVLVWVYILLSINSNKINNDNKVDNENEISDNYVGITTNDLSLFEDKIKNSFVYEKKVSVVMVGDALIHQSIYLDAYKNGKYDFKSIFKYIKPIVKEYDIAYYNQETVLGGKEIGVSTYPRFNSPYEVGDAFIDAGFNMVSLANNHTLDRGKNALVNANKYWKKHPEVLTNGSALSYEERNADKIFEKNGITYTMLSYTTQTNGISIPNKENYLVNLYDKDTVKKDIERVRSKVDVLFVAMHWGTEYTNYPTAEQKEIAKYLASLGVDVIIGAHPHVVEPVDFIGKTLVIYSLGNFVSSQNGPNNLTGLMMSVNIKKKYDENGVSITLEEPTARLLYTKYTEGSPRRNFVVYPYDKLNNNILNNYKTHYNKYINIVAGSDKIVKYPLNS